MGVRVRRATKETINAMFEIDPGRNGGLDFQFEEVVRDREKRKGMHGGDCECCRDVRLSLRCTSSGSRATAHIMGFLPVVL